MYIQALTIENFGGIRNYHRELTPKLNLLESRYGEEIAAAIGFLLCSKAEDAIPEHWLQESTCIGGTIVLAESSFCVCAKPVSGRLQLVATDLSGEDVSESYCYAMSHCREQDDSEIFDAGDRTVPLRLYRYRCEENAEDISCRTDRFADTKMFRAYLCRYIRDFRPEPINSQKKYETIITPQGEFDVAIPCLGGKVHLSETEERLFRYSCFLNIAEFWTELEKIRDMHHEKKPLLVQNFVEFLDESVNISSLIARTKKLHRQTIILTRPLEKGMKGKWMFS